MKKIIILFIAAISAWNALRAADGDLFPYPQAPAELERLDERCDFIISRFWRPCDFKSAMSKTEKLRSTFSDWVGLMPYASVDTVYTAINALLAKVEKSGPHTLMLARMAEEYTYSDSSDIKSAEIFLPFAKAAANHKKIDGASRAHFREMAQRIENTMTGKPVEHFNIITPDGQSLGLGNYRTQLVAIVFNSHDNSDSSLARLRLSVDHNIKKLTDRGLLTIVSVEPGKPTPEWLAATASYPAGWSVGAMPDAADWFELDSRPTIMLLDSRHRVLAKGLSVEDLMLTMERMAATL